MGVLSLFRRTQQSYSLSVSRYRRCNHCGGQAVFVNAMPNMGNGTNVHYCCRRCGRGFYVCRSTRAPRIVHRSATRIYLAA